LVDVVARIPADAQAAAPEPVQRCCSAAVQQCSSAAVQQCERAFHDPAIDPEDGAVFGAASGDDRGDLEPAYPVAVALVIIATAGVDARGRCSRWPALPQIGRMASISRMHWMSWMTSLQMPPATTVDSGTPWASTMTWLLLPVLSRSPRDGPAAADHGVRRRRGRADRLHRTEKGEPVTPRCQGRPWPARTRATHVQPHTQAATWPEVCQRPQDRRPDGQKLGPTWATDSDEKRPKAASTGKHLMERATVQ
jgi:hypothetical protein